MPLSANLRRLGTAALVGLAASYGARYLARRVRRSALGAPQIDWEQARRVALRVSRWEEARVMNRAAARERYAHLVAQSEPRIAQYLGVNLPRPIEHVHVVDRREWLEANFSSLAVTLAPFEEMLAKIRERQEGLGVLFTSGRLAGAQIGFLFGFLARRVLGQYDLGLLSPDPEVRGSLYFVEPNIARVQQQLGLEAEDFRLWIALHEVTHVFEFEAYPWVRPYFNDLLRQLLDELANQFAEPSMGFPQFLGRVARGRFSGRHWIEEALTPRGRKLFDKLQALMSLVEGYSNHLMKTIGEELLPSFEEIERRVNQRMQQRPLLEELLDRIIGMDLKLAQYKQGETFVRSVVDARGPAFINRVWESAEHLPTMAEIRSPQQWIARMESA